MGNYDYRKIDFATQKILVQNCNVTFPINILNLIKQFPNIELMTYQEFDNEEMNSGFLARTISSDAFTMQVGTNEYIIVYNDDTFENLSQRIRFSLAHELGHIHLDHFQFGESILARGHFGINDKQYSYFEKEADLFANKLLAPSYLVPNEWEPKLVANVFDISSSSAKITCDIRRRFPWVIPQKGFIDEFKKAGYFVRKSYLDNKSRNEEFYNGFQKIFLGTIFHFCSNCKSLELNINEELKYCSICGSSDLKKVRSNRYFQFHETDEQEVKFFPRGDNNEMNYRILKLDSEGRLAQPCPKCENEHPIGNFCSVCGSEIINKCTGQRERESGFVTTSDPCTTPLKGHERYCPECGSHSTFLNNGLLPAWDDIEMPF
jgi:Predicted Zn peptidase